jgi:putative cell wall-binding protein
MKKVLSIALASVLLFSCTKEQAKECNCGLVVSDDVADYSVVIRNSCSGNERRFVLQPGDWINAGVGENYCIYNVTSW